MEQGYIAKIANEINIRSRHYNLGKLQQLRKEIHQKRLASQNIFTSATTFDEWAFHYGGRKELQFNIGLEPSKKHEEIRFGVAFSLERSQTLPNIEKLVPNIGLFNDYMLNNPDGFTEMRMWWHYQDKRSDYYLPSIIPPELVTEGRFIFLGIRQPIDRLDYDAALRAMDKLLPLYLYTESGGKLEQSKQNEKSLTFQFKPGCTPKPSSANASLAEKKLDIQLRHNDIQAALYQKLSEKYGFENVGTELSSGNGAIVDLVVQHPDKYWFYEIKIAHTAKACIRQAIGQLLEYSYWPNNQEATRLVIVGEPEFDEEARKYIKTLKARFALPIEYESIEI